jgi:hypothetical protein
MFCHRFQCATLFCQLILVLICTLLLSSFIYSMFGISNNLVSIFRDCMLAPFLAFLLLKYRYSFISRMLNMQDHRLFFELIIDLFVVKLVKYYHQIASFMQRLLLFSFTLLNQLSFIPLRFIYSDDFLLRSWV